MIYLKMKSLEKIVTARIYKMMGVFLGKFKIAQKPTQL